MAATMRSRMQATSFAATVLGLLVLLVVPIVAEQRTLHYHGLIEETTIPAHDKVNGALDVARAARNAALSTYLGVGPEVLHATSPGLATTREYGARWRRATEDDSAIHRVGGEAWEDWRAGVAAITRWLAEDEPRFVTGRQPMSRRELSAASARFNAGINHLTAARSAIEDRQSHLRDAIVGLDHKEVLVAVPLSLICLSLVALAWRTLQDLRRSQDRLRLSVRETNHRIKNNLHVVGALLDLELMEDGECVSRRALEGVAGQIGAMAAVHDFLSTQSGDTVNADALLSELVTLVEPAARIRASVAAAPVPLSPQKAVALALIVNELLLNAGKHGAHTASVRLRHLNSTTVLEVHDDGPGFPPGFDPVKCSHVGLSLVQTLATHDLKGRAELLNDDGALVRVTFPV